MAKSNTTQHTTHNTQHTNHTAQQHTHSNLHFCQKMTTQLIADYVANMQADLSAFLANATAAAAAPAPAPAATPELFDINWDDTHSEYQTQPDSSEDETGCAMPIQSDEDADPEDPEDPDPEDPDPEDADPEVCPSGEMCRLRCEIHRAGNTPAASDADDDDADDADYDDDDDAAPEDAETNMQAQLYKHLWVYEMGPMPASAQSAMESVMGPMPTTVRQKVDVHAGMVRQLAPLGFEVVSVRSPVDGTLPEHIIVNYPFLTVDDQTVQVHSIQCNAVSLPVYKCMDILNIKETHKTRKRLQKYQQRLVEANEKMESLQLELGNTDNSLQRERLRVIIAKQTAYIANTATKVRTLEDAAVIDAEIHAEAAETNAAAAAHVQVQVQAPAPPAPQVQSPPPAPQVQTPQVQSPPAQSPQVQTPQVQTPKRKRVKKRAAKDTGTKVPKWGVSAKVWHDDDGNPVVVGSSVWKHNEPKDLASLKDHKDICWNPLEQMSGGCVWKKTAWRKNSSKGQYTSNQYYMVMTEYDQLRPVKKQRTN